MIDKIKIKEIAYHRNGISGNGFHVVLFSFKDENKKIRNMISTVFEEVGSVTVLDVGLLASGCIAFAQNSWRGDQFENQLRTAIKTLINY